MWNLKASRKVESFLLLVLFLGMSSAQQILWDLMVDLKRSREGAALGLRDGSSRTEPEAGAAKAEKARKMVATRTMEALKIILGVAV